MSGEVSLTSNVKSMSVVTNVTRKQRRDYKSVGGAALGKKAYWWIGMYFKNTVTPAVFTLTS